MKQNNNIFNILKGEINRNNRSMKQRFDWLRKGMINGQNAMVKKILDIDRNIGLKKDCLELYFSGRRQSGVYTIRPTVNTKLRVYCDHVTDGGGWTVVQRRRDSSTSFQRTWIPYKEGFGDLTRNFWLGNDNLHVLTSLSGDSQVLRVDLEDWAGHKMYATYSKFKVENETKQYRLKLGKYNGNAGNAAIGGGKTLSMSGMKFSTVDRDNDKSVMSCAKEWRGGWWFNSCFSAFLNGPYIRDSSNTNNCTGIHWFHHADKCEFSIKKTEMKLRRIST